MMNYYNMYRAFKRGARPYKVTSQKTGEVRYTFGNSEQQMKNRFNDKWYIQRISLFEYLCNKIF